MASSHVPAVATVGVVDSEAAEVASGASAGFQGLDAVEAAGLALADELLELPEHELLWVLPPVVLLLLDEPGLLLLDGVVGPDAVRVSGPEGGILGVGGGCDQRERSGEQDASHDGSPVAG